MTTFGGYKGSVTASMGVASYNAGTVAPDALLKRADEAVYAAKHQGRNRCIPASTLEEKRDAA